MTATHPYLSVIVPVHQGHAYLPTVLPALAASTLPRGEWELIVVDDASTDDTATLAAGYADTVVRLAGKPHGPAYARNRGFEVSRGDVIVFIDADVAVHTDTLASFAHVFRTEPEMGAAFGAYDDKPPAKSFISQYRNLLHRYHHLTNPGEADTFWAGCGAIRAQAFVDAQMYDEWHFSRPQIEDVELGHRLRARGYRIEIRPEIESSHLKRWTFRSMIATDLNDRGVPWSWLLVAQGTTLSSSSLNSRGVEKLATVMIWLLLVFTLVAMITGDMRFLIAAAACSAPALVVNRNLYRYFARTRGAWFALRVVPVHMLYYVLNGVAVGFGIMLHELVGHPSPSPAVQARSEVGLETWPPVPVKRSRWSNPRG